VWGDNTDSLSNARTIILSGFKRTKGKPWIKPNPERGVRRPLKEKIAFKSGLGEAMEGVGRKIRELTAKQKYPKKSLVQGKPNSINR